MWNKVTRLSQFVAIILFVAVFFVGFALGKKAATTDRTLAQPIPVQSEEPVVSGKINGNPTTFSYDGTITFKNDAEVGQKTPYFNYTEAETNNVSTAKLVFDEMSSCAQQNGATPCMAMSVTFDIPFNNKRAVVEGIRQGDEVLVRKLYTLQNGEEPRVPGTNQTFITWPQAVNFINSCATKMVMQTHTLDVYITMKDGTHLRAVEPMIDEVFKITRAANDTCGDIGVATE